MVHLHGTVADNYNSCTRYQRKLGVQILATRETLCSSPTRHYEVIRQYDSSNTGELDRNINNPALQAERFVLLSDKSNLFYQGHTGLRSRTVRCQ